MNREAKAALVERVLTRASEQLDDVAETAITSFYRRFPEARASFETHGLGRRGQLEGLMIENSLHCLMYWFESPGEVEILLEGSVPHHTDTLDVPPQWYAELLDATAGVIATTIPASEVSEGELWQQLRQALRAIVERSREQIAPPERTG